MTPRLRRFAFMAHVTFSLGWFGAVVAYFALAFAGLTSSDVLLARSAYLSMEVLGWWVVIPLSLSALGSGLVLSLGTEWGLFRHYWVTTKFLMASVGSIILLTHMRVVGQMSQVARATSFSTGAFGGLRIQLVVHAAGGLLVLAAATALSVYKPWGMTPYGARRTWEAAAPVRAVEGPGPDSRRWLYGFLGILGLGTV